ncbi:MAG: FlgO family outer membrane protein [Thermodesulfobacteriota bacterium]|nr:FlgO family outer membrane protein [Thermodesulfobacteriota bacterium]
MRFIWGKIIIVLLFTCSAGFVSAAGWPRTEAETVPVSMCRHDMDEDYVYRLDEAVLPPENLTWSERFLAFFQKKEKAPVELPNQGQEFKLRIRELAHQLLANAREEIIDEFTVTVSTFVNLNHLYTTSGLGRYLGEQMMHELQVVGLDVVDVRLAPAMMISERFGEYAMSRDMAELSYVHPGDAMLVGTYTISNNEIFINARLLRNRDGMVISGGSTVFELNGVSGGLLQDEGRPPRSGSKVRVRPFEETALVE